jgi:hypothetical protein
MEESTQSDDLEMRIVELENQLKELRAAQEAAGGAQAGAQVASPCGYCYCSCYCDTCYVAASPQAGAQAAMPCRPCAVQAALPCNQCSAQASPPCSPCNVQTATPIAIPIYICRICYPCIFECICGPCNICSFGGGFGGGGIRFGGLGG